MIEFRRLGIVMRPLKDHLGSFARFNPGIQLKNGIACENGFFRKIPFVFQPFIRVKERHIERHRVSFQKNGAVIWAVLVPKMENGRVVLPNLKAVQIDQKRPDSRPNPSKTKPLNARRERQGQQRITFHERPAGIGCPKFGVRPGHDDPDIDKEKPDNRPLKWAGFHKKERKKGENGHWRVNQPPISPTKKDTPMWPEEREL